MTFMRITAPFGSSLGRGCRVARRNAEGYSEMKMDEQSQTERPARRWTLEEFERMSEAGIFGPEERIELIDGEILPMRPENPEHAAVIGIAQRRLQKAFGERFYIRPGNPVPLDEWSQPEPDLAVVRGKPEDYRKKHPRTALLVVEVSFSSRSFDRGRKQLLYARTGIPEYWMIDLVERCVFVHRDPAKKGYRDVTKHESGSVRPLHASGSVSIDDLLG